MWSSAQDDEDRAMTKIVYKPFSILLGILGGMAAGALFKRMWAFAAEEPVSPKATDRDRHWVEVVAAAAIEGAVFGGIKALVDRGGAHGFEHLTGTWPGRTETKTRS
jgi:hypothetical protein